MKNSTTTKYLYRGKDKETDNWVFGYYVRLHDDKGHVSHRIYPGYAESDCGDYYPDWHEVYEESVGLFSGLPSDKNGKQIFENDVCRVSRPCVLAYGKISLQNGCFWFIDDGCDAGMLRLCDIKMNGFEIEVVGNITDNPDLLTSAHQ